MSATTSTTTSGTNGTAPVPTGTVVESANLIPAGTYEGRMVKVDGDLEKSKQKGTRFYRVLCEITQDGPFKGRRMMWNAFMGPKLENAARTMEAFTGSGCTFERGPRDFTGIGKNPQYLDVRHEDYQPEPTDEERQQNVTPDKRRVAKIAFINNGPPGMRGEALTEAEVTEADDFAAQALAMAKSGAHRKKSSGPDKDGYFTDEGGTLRGADGKPKF